MQVESSIDYMQFTSDKPFSNKSGEYELKKSTMKNYQVMRVLESGFTSHHGHNKSNRWNNVASGKVCQQIPDQLEFVKNVIKNGAVFSRIDFTLTVFDGMEISYFRSLIRDGKVTGALMDSSAKSIINDKTQVDETTNLGDLKKRAKRGMFRAYDKAVQLNLEDCKITRFELEERSKRADVTAKRFASGMSVGDLIQQRVNVDDDLWREMCGLKSEKLPRFKSGDDDDDDDEGTWKWLLETVAKTLGRKIADEIYVKKSAEKYEQFNAIVQAQYIKTMNQHLFKNRADVNDEVYTLEF